MILKTFKAVSTIFTMLLIVATSSCNKDDSQPNTELVNSDYKDPQLNSGFINNGITINAKKWSVEYVKDAISGELLLDKAGKPMILNAFGSVELQTGWLKLEKKQGDVLLNLSFSIDAFALIGAESTACVWLDTIPLFTHMVNTLLNNVSNREAG